MTILERIMARKREEVAARRPRISEGELREQAAAQSPPRGFARALLARVAQGGVGVIAEIKRASPSRGVIHPGVFEAAAIARGYEEHGATCLSCLTDRDFFQGDESYLIAARGACSLPVLRKDFLYHPYQVAEARAWGADAILLIQGVLSIPQARELEHAALELGLDVLVEVHDEAELEAAHSLATPLLGINNRDLKSFVTSLDTTLRLAPRVAVGRLVVSESGIATGDDVKRLRAHGVHAFLVGEAFMREAEPGPALGRFLREAEAA